MATPASTVSNPSQNVVLKSINGSEFLVFKRALKINGKSRDIAIRLLTSQGNITGDFLNTVSKQFEQVRKYYQQIIDEQTSPRSLRNLNNLAISYQRIGRRETFLSSTEENPLQRLNECAGGDIRSFNHLSTKYDSESIEATRHIFNLFLQGRTSPGSTPVSTPATPNSPSASAQASPSSAPTSTPSQTNLHSTATTQPLSALTPTAQPSLPNPASSSGATGLSSFSPFTIATRFANSLKDRFTKLFGNTSQPISSVTPLAQPTLPAPSQTNVPSAALNLSSPSILPQSPLVGGPLSPQSGSSKKRRVPLSEKRPPAISLSAPNSPLNRPASLISFLPPGRGSIVSDRSPLSLSRPQSARPDYEMDILNLTPSTASPSPTPPATPRVRLPLRPQNLDHQGFVQAMDEVPPSPTSYLNGLRYSHLTKRPAGVVDDRIIRARRAVSALISNPQNNEEEPRQMRNWMGRLTDRAAENLPRDKAAANVVRWMECARSDYLPKGKTPDNLINSLI